MFKTTVLMTAMAAACSSPSDAFAANDQELTEIRAQIHAMKDAYEARLQALEQRLQQAQVQAQVQPQTQAQVQVQAPTPNPPDASAAPARTASNAFNPNIALVLGGTMSNLSQDPARYRLQGFIPSGGEVGPGKRSFNLGESELTLSANIDPMFSGQLTFALSGENEAGVEEAFFQTRALFNGVNFKAGRFLSSVGYLNNQHAHTWDFVDAPLAYQAFLGGQYRPDGIQAKWLLRTDRFVELGMELGNGASFPGSERNKNGFGAGTVFAHVGDDIGDSGSWRAGLSYLRSSAADRSYDDAGVSNAFSGTSATWIADAIYKWAPNGNSTQQNFKLQAEYFRRKENGTLASVADSVLFDSRQTGWYLQGVYQFMPNWRTGLRYDHLSSGRFDSGASSAASFPTLAPYSPSKASLMLDYSPSEFSRLRLQLARDKSRPDAVDNQIFLQYIMSLGTHAAHAF